MAGAHEKLERAEHAAHSGDHKLFGVTMALIGVLVAFCAAMVGSERNELTRAMIEQTQAHADYTSASAKYRMVMIELEKQRARILSAKDAPGGWSPVERFIELAGDYSRERNLSKTWSESYKPLVEAHFDAAEGYEQAQLIAEIGIVLASLGVLLASRSAWLLSVALAVGCFVQVGRTFFPTGKMVRQTMARISNAEEAYMDLRKEHVGANEDEVLVERLDEGGRIREALQAKAKSRAQGVMEARVKR